MNPGPRGLEIDEGCLAVEQHRSSKIEVVIGTVNRSETYEITA